VYEDQAPGQYHQKLSPDFVSTSGIMILKLTINEKSHTLKLVKKPM
jgi:hypothetical protein